jgi:hypothetical protein
MSACRLLDSSPHASEKLRPRQAREVSTSQDLGFGSVPHSSSPLVLANERACEVQPNANQDWVQYAPITLTDEAVKECHLDRDRNALQQEEQKLSPWLSFAGQHVRPAVVDDTREEKAPEYSPESDQ